MKKTKARIISLALIVALFITMLPDMNITAYAKDGRTTGFTIYYDTEALEKHGAKTSTGEEFEDHKDYNPDDFNGSIQFDDIEFPESPISSDGAKFLYWGIALDNKATYEIDSNNPEDWAPYIVWDKELFLESIELNDEYADLVYDIFLDPEYEAVFSKYMFIPIWEDDLKLSNGLIPLEGKSFQYVLFTNDEDSEGEYPSEYKADYLSNTVDDKKGEYDYFQLVGLINAPYAFNDEVCDNRSDMTEMISKMFSQMHGTFSVNRFPFSTTDTKALVVDYDYVNGEYTVFVYTIDDYAVMFDTNELLYASDVLDVKEGELVKKPKNPVVKGYNFEGWYKDEAYTTPWDFENDKVTDNTVIYGKFTKTINLVANGGTVNGKSTDKCMAIYQGKLGTLPTPVRDGYKFLGWTFDSESDEIIKGDEIVTDETSNYVFAKWEKLPDPDPDPNPNPNPGPNPGPSPDPNPNPNPGPSPDPSPDPDPNPDKAVITFDVDGGDTSSNSIVIVPGKDPGEMPTATKENVLFGGWYDQFGNKVTDLSTLTKDTKLTARWENITVVAKQKLDVNENFKSAKEAYIANAKAEAEKNGSTFDEGKVKWKYKILTDSEFEASLSCNSAKFNKADIGKAGINKKGMLTCKKSGLVAVQLQVREKVNGKNTWVNTSNKDVLFVAIEKFSKVKNSKTTLTSAGETVSMNKLIKYENSSAVGNLPNFAECTITSSKPGVATYNDKTNEIVAVANGKTKIVITYKTVASTSKSGKVKYSKVKLSIPVKVKIGK